MKTNLRHRYGGGSAWRKGALACALVAAGLMADRTVAEDSVELAGGAKGSVSTVRGTVLDYNGRQVVVRGADGRDQNFPSARVVRITTDYLPQQREADRLFAERRYPEALQLYMGVQTVEIRPWVRRQLLARQVWCHRLTGQYTLAGRTFLTLVEQDPETPYFDCIPLVWAPGVTPGLNAAEAGQWLANHPSPVGQLLGASHLLATHRGDARPKLFALSKLPHPFVPWLAEAQMWRADYVTVDGALVAGWERDLEKFPPTMQAGPSFVLGMAWEHHRRPELAAASFLRAPVLDARDRPLAALGLWRAGENLLRTAQPEEARRALQELVRDYPEIDGPVAEAKQRLAGLPPPQK